MLDIIDLYYNQIGEDIKNITRLNKKIELFIDLININLAEKRNKFAKNTLNLEIVSFSYSISLFSTYLLGTNLKNHLETNDYAFLIIVIITIIINIPIYFILRCLFNDFFIKKLIKKSIKKYIFFLRRIYFHKDLNLNTIHIFLDQYLMLF